MGTKENVLRDDLTASVVPTIISLFLEILSLLKKKKKKTKTKGDRITQVECDLLAGRSTHHYFPNMYLQLQSLPHLGAL